MIRLLQIVAAIAAIGAPCLADEVWRSADGSKTTEATLLRITGGQLEFLKGDRVFTVEPDKMDQSQLARHYAKNMTDDYVYELAAKWIMVDKGSPTRFDLIEATLPVFQIAEPGYALIVDSSSTIYAVKTDTSQLHEGAEIKGRFYKSGTYIYHDLRGARRQVALFEDIAETESGKYLLTRNKLKTATNVVDFTKGIADYQFPAYLLHKINQKQEYQRQQFAEQEAERKKQAAADYELAIRKKAATAAQKQLLEAEIRIAQEGLADNKINLSDQSLTPTRRKQLETERQMLLEKTNRLILELKAIDAP